MRPLNAFSTRETLWLCLNRNLPHRNHNNSFNQNSGQFWATILVLNWIAGISWFCLRDKMGVFFLFSFFCIFIFILLHAKIILKHVSSLLWHHKNFVRTTCEKQFLYFPVNFSEYHEFPSKSFLEIIAPKSFFSLYFLKIFMDSVKSISSDCPRWFIFVPLLDFMD